MSTKPVGSSLTSLLDELNIRAGTELLAIKRTLVLQLRQAMKRRGVSQSRLAKEMRTSRTVINRMLDPRDTGVTLATLTRASQVLGFRVAIRFSPTRGFGRMPDGVAIARQTPTERPSAGKLTPISPRPK